MDIKSFIIKMIDRHPKDIVNLSMQKFRVTRPAIHKHLNALIAEGKIVSKGKTRNKTYYHASIYKTVFDIPISPSLKEDFLWLQKVSPSASEIPESLLDICEYGFTEMVNNVIDHSRAKRLTVDADFSGRQITLRISDDGVGIFEKIRKTLKLETFREAILHLSKGKVTTDPEHHTGEGVFFTSRGFDRFSLTANGLVYVRFGEDDWLVDNAAKSAGTLVEMQIDRASHKKLREIFNHFGGPDGDYAFSKTRVVVRLGLLPGETYISRSQAKRILFGLEKFRQITLDFKRVETVGQGFVDEVFRVFQNGHPEVTIDSVHANENVAFMIRRGLD